MSTLIDVFSLTCLHIESCFSVPEILEYQPMKLVYFPPLFKKNLNALDSNILIAPGFIITRVSQMIPDRKDERKGYNPKLHKKGVDPVRFPWDYQSRSY